MKNIFALALIVTLFAPMACTKQAEEVPMTEELPYEEMAPMSDDAALPTDSFESDSQTSEEPAY
jgi:hypothetical protein